MKLLSRDNPARPLIFLCFGYIVMGYALFFTARALPTPTWGPGLMAWCAPVVESLYEAIRIGLFKGHDPFPIQLVILYCVLGMPLLVLYSIKINFLNVSAREMWFNNIVMHNRGKSNARVKLFFLGLSALFIFSFFPYLEFFTGRYSNSVGWRTVSIYSPTLFATSFFLGLSMMMLFISDSIACIYMAFSRHLNPPTVTDTKEHNHGRN